LTIWDYCNAGGVPKSRISVLEGKKNPQTSLKEIFYSFLV